MAEQRVLTEGQMFALRRSLASAGMESIATRIEEDDGSVGYIVTATMRDASTGNVCVADVDDSSDLVAVKRSLSRDMSERQRDTRRRIQAQRDAI